MTAAALHIERHESNRLASASDWTRRCTAFLKFSLKLDSPWLAATS